MYRPVQIRTHSEIVRRFFEHVKGMVANLQTPGGCTLGDIGGGMGEMDVRVKGEVIRIQAQIFFAWNGKIGERELQLMQCNEQQFVT